MGPLAAHRRRPQVRLQGTNHPRKGGQAVLPPRPGRVDDGRPAGLRRRAVRPHLGAADRATTLGRTTRRSGAVPSATTTRRYRPGAGRRTTSVQRQAKPQRLQAGSTTSSGSSPRTSTSASSSFSPSAAWRSTPSSWAAGRPTASTASSAPSAPAPSSSATRSRSACPSSASSRHRLAQPRTHHRLPALARLEHPLSAGRGPAVRGQRLRGVQSSAVRPAGDGAGTGGRLPHRVHAA